MSRSKKDLKEYFSFSKSQTQGIILLSILCLLGVGLYFYMDRWISMPAPEVDDIAVDKLLSSIYIDTSYDRSPTSPRTLSPFNFDPNILDEKGFIKLGLRPRLVKTILNYRSKGGRFYKKEDFKKIWGLHEEEYRQLASYITIPKNKKRFDNKSNSYSLHLDDSERAGQLSIEINTAAAKEFIELRGIAEKLAGNILKYRKMLGGFYSIEQLKEVYGIRPETFQQIKKHLKCDPKRVVKININEATLKEMKAHPYLRKGDWALAIVRFRKAQDYDIKALEDLKQIEGMTDAAYNKLVPYLRLQ